MTKEAMSHEKMELLVLRGVISGLSKAEQEKVETTAKAIKDVIMAAGAEGVMALALVGAEVAADEWPPRPDIMKMITGEN